MSIWSRCYGRIVVPKDSGFSFKKYIESIYDEVDLTIHQEDLEYHGVQHIRVHFSVQFSLDGMCASNLIEMLIARIETVGAILHLSEVHSEIRWL